MNAPSPTADALAVVQRIADQHAADAMHHLERAAAEYRMAGREPEGRILRLAISTIRRMERAP